MVEARDLGYTEEDLKLRRMANYRLLTTMLRGRNSDSDGRRACVKMSIRNHGDGDNIVTQKLGALKVTCVMDVVSVEKLIRALFTTHPERDGTDLDTAGKLKVEVHQGKTGQTITAAGDVYKKQLGFRSGQNTIQEAVSYTHLDVYQRQI